MKYLWQWVQGWEWGVTTNRHEGSFGGDGNVLQLDWDDGRTTL